MFFKRIKIKKDIPYDLRLEFKKLEENKKSITHYSLSPSDTILENAINEIKDTRLEPSFKDVLFNFIDKKKLTDPEVYKKAMIDKRVFSKIRTGKSKNVSRNTAICLALALELNQDDFDKLLKSNHNYLSDNEYFDIAIKWCVRNKIYDIEQVNDILYACDLNLLTK